MRSPFFALLIISLFVLISFVNYHFLIRRLGFFRSGRWRLGFWLATVAAGLIVGYGWYLRQLAAPVLSEGFMAAAYAAFAWITGQVALLVLLPVVFIVWLAARVIGPASTPRDASAPAAMSRREFLHNAFVAAPLLSVGIGANGVYTAQTTMTVQRRDLPFPRLPAALDGLKIAQLSDTHLGPYFDLDRLSTALGLIKDAKPDLLVITGDLIDDLSLLAPALSRISALAPQIPHGIYFCWGNHEYFRNITLIRQSLQASPITLLENRSALIIPGEQPLFLAGVDYPMSNDPDERSRQRRRYMAEACASLPPEAFTVLIAHHPDFLFDGFAARIPLTLAGHSHGGQVVVFGKSLFPLPYTYMRGLYQENQVYGYVNSGAGQWLPFRLGCPPEISIMTLRATRFS